MCCRCGSSAAAALAAGQPNGRTVRWQRLADRLGCELTVLMPAFQSCKLRLRGAGRQAAAGGGHDSDCETDYQSGSATDGEEELPVPLQPNYSEVNSADLLAQLATQLATLSVAAGDVVAVPAGEDDGSGDTFWLLKADGPARQLTAPLQFSDTEPAFEAGETIVSGHWFERWVHRDATGQEHVPGAPCAVYATLTGVRGECRSGAAAACPARAASSTLLGPWRE